MIYIRARSGERCRQASGQFWLRSAGMGAEPRACLSEIRSPGLTTLRLQNETRKYSPLCPNCRQPAGKQCASTATEEQRTSGNRRIACVACSGVGFANSGRAKGRSERIFFADSFLVRLGFLVVLTFGFWPAGFHGDASQKNFLKHLWAI